jgi:hypothetical protein
MQAPTSQSQEPRHDFGLRELLTPSPPPFQSDFGLRELLTPSPPPLQSDFGLRELLTPSPPPLQSDSDMREPSPTLSSLPGPRDEIGVQGTHTPSPVSGHNSDLRAEELPFSESQDNIGTQAVPLPEPQGSGGSSQRPRESHIASPHMHLTMILAGWNWGDRAPIPLPSTIGEGKRRDESVCQAIQTLVRLLTNTFSRMIPIPMD